MSGDPCSSRAGPRALLAVLTILTTAGGAWVFWQSLHADGPAWLSLVLLSVFVVLFSLVSFSFWMATAGFVCALLAKRALPQEANEPRLAAAAPGKTAIVMPIYNESPHRVFSGLRAIHESLQATGQGRAFDFFVLSDTTNPDVWLAEELAWARLNQAIGDGSCVYYRHRPKNAGRKAGNIADFCQRWGWAYRYMIVLDADSVMSGETMVEMVRRMDDDPETGILQVPPMPVNQVSLLARCQQFAASVYGPVFLQGFAWWSHVDGNYWGHNAIIRIEPFVNHCGLSRLPGAEPLGGEILSHDFVEAALMRRAGLKVRLATDLDGSYEECPPSLIDFAQRDQRWCQGNMQHIRLVFSSGLHPVSRLHLGLGAMSYLSSPIWLLFLVLSFLLASISDTAGRDAPHGAAGWWPLGLFAATMLMLLLPKLWGFILLACDAKRLARCGGATRAAASVAIETAVSMLVSPIMMAFHSNFVISTFLGRRIEWTAQRRDEQGQQLLAAVSAHWKQSLAGLAAALAIWSVAPAMLPWLAPVLVGLLLAIPLSVLVSSVPIGRAMASRNFLATPEETAVPQVLQRHRHLLGLPPLRELTDPGGVFRRILADPAFVALHRSVLLATDAARPAEPEQIELAERQLIAGGPARVSIENRRAILSDPAALHALHRFAWTRTRKDAS
jgi:membrane glycosyltransferase